MSFPKSLLVAILLLLFPSLKAVAAETSGSDYVLLPDSSNFVKASVVVASPGNKFYSNLGHVAVRMECPVHGLDYCFSFLSDDNTLGILNFFAGKAEGRIYAVPTEEYLAPFVEEGRGVEQWELNLTLHEKQRLWMLLDEDMVDEGMRRFNFVQNNCTSIALTTIDSALIEGDEARFLWPDVTCNVDNANLLKVYTKNAPWMQFLCMLLWGTEGEQTWDNMQRMAPEILIPLLKNSTIGCNGQQRPFLTGDNQELAQKKVEAETCAVSPNLVFGSLLAVVALLSMAELKLRWRKAARIMDALLLTGVTIGGTLLLYITLAAGLFGVHWNWFLIPLSPLPALIWIYLKRNNKQSEHVYAFYAVALSAFILYGLTLSVCTPPHLLLTAALALRCAAKSLYYKSIN